MCSAQQGYNLLYDLLSLLQELSVMRTDMAAVVEGFFDGTFSSKGIDRDGLVVRSQHQILNLLAAVLVLPLYGASQAMYHLC